MQSVVWGVLIDLGVFTLLAALLFRYLEKSETGLRTVIWAFVAAELASALVNALAGMRRAPIPYLSAGQGCVITLLAALALRWLRPPAYRRAVRGFGVLLVLAGCSMVWMVPELLYQGLRPQRADAVVPRDASGPGLRSNGPPCAGPGGSCGSCSTSFPMIRPSSIGFPVSPCRPLTSFKSKSVVFSNLQAGGVLHRPGCPLTLSGHAGQQHPQQSGWRSNRSIWPEQAVASLRCPGHHSSLMPSAWAGPRAS